jgi:hypothetical protein
MTVKFQNKFFLFYHIKLIFNLFYILFASFLNFCWLAYYSLNLFVIKAVFNDKIFFEVLGNNASLINLFWLIDSP